MIQFIIFNFFYARFDSNICFSVDFILILDYDDGFIKKAYELMNMICKSYAYFMKRSLR